MELSPKEWIDLVLTLGLWVFMAGKTLGWLSARSETHKGQPSDEWRMKVEASLSAGNERFKTIDKRFDKAGEDISDLATKVQGLQLTIEDRADTRFARLADTEHRLAMLEQTIRNDRAERK